MSESSDPEGLRVFYYLVQDLKALVFSLISLHFKVGLAIVLGHVSRRHALIRYVDQAHLDYAKHLRDGVGVLAFSVLQNMDYRITAENMDAEQASGVQNHFSCACQNLSPLFRPVDQTSNSM